MVWTACGPDGAGWGLGVFCDQHPVAPINNKNNNSVAAFLNRRSCLSDLCFIKARARIADNRGI